MKLVSVSLQDLKPYENNPRINDNAVESVMNSIKEFGFKVPVVITKDNVIVAGHTRYKASKKLGLEKVPCIVADDLTEEQIKAFRLADNKVSELAEWDLKKLEIELSSIALDMSLFNFDMAELSTEIDKHKEVEEDNFNVDEALEEISTPTVKRGQLWKLGNHFLLCGDSTSKDDVRKLMNGNKANLVLTDPPYNMNYAGAGNTPKSKREKSKILNDNLNDDDFELFLINVNKALSDVMLDGASFYIFYKELGKGVFITSLEKGGLTFKQELIWLKNHLVLGGSKYQNIYEPCLFGCKGESISIWNGGRKQTSVIDSIDMLNDIEVRNTLRELIETLDVDVIRENKQMVNDLHPTMKPLKLLAKFIMNSSNVNDIVLDVFGGSGSTLITCEQLNRQCFTMELDEKYCDVIIKRWEDLTGKKAVLVDETSID